jgi:3',5'-cyclic AMP phosphodiesterase CpdA
MMRRFGPCTWTGVWVLLSVSVLPNAGCNTPVEGVPLANESKGAIDTDRFTLVARLVHISDSHVIDEQSPARVTSASNIVPAAWRPQEAYSIQLLDGLVRVTNQMHVAQGTIDFLVHTGDVCDNRQSNELDWFVRAMDGGLIDPRSGPDDRNPADKPDPLLDPHEPFDAQGIYQQGTHGDRPSIPWYVVPGNHDHFAIGVFPITQGLFGHRTAPLPADGRFAIFLPTQLDPVGGLTWAPVSPARPGPPAIVNLPTTIEVNPARDFFDNATFVAAMLASTSEPAGHGFSIENPNQTWYSATPVPGVRLIGIDSSTPGFIQPKRDYHQGAISADQRVFLDAQLQAADAAGEIAVLLTHHPSRDLDPANATSLTQQSLVDLLHGHPSLRLHLAGHSHRNAVTDRGGYLEIETGAVIDTPQQGRIIEIWRDGDEIELRYRMFSHLDMIEPDPNNSDPIFTDPYRPLRQRAQDLALTHNG